MPKYCVNLERKSYFHVKVEAGTPEKAEFMAAEIVNTDGAKPIDSDRAFVCTSAILDNEAIISCTI